MSRFHQPNNGEKKHNIEDITRNKEENEALESAKEYFHEFDKDGSGAISRDEFALLYDDLVTCGFSLGSLQSALQELDSNGDGEISMDEYTFWLGQTNQRCAFQREFDSYDLDGSGDLDIEEFKYMCREKLGGHDLCDEELELGFSRLNASGDGLATFKEFEKWSLDNNRFRRLELSAVGVDCVAEAMTYFKYFDADKSGAIDKEEFGELYEDLRGRCKMESRGFELGSVDYCRCEMDADANGLVTFSEYIHWLIDIGSLSKDIFQNHIGEEIPLSWIVFCKYDEDGSNTIEADEFWKMCYDMGHYLNEEQLKFAVNRLDVNGSGQISYDEFATWWKDENRFEKVKLTEEGRERLMAASKYFRQFDCNHTGSVSSRDFSSIYKDLLACGFPLDSLAATLQEIDSDGNGLISFNEYLDWLVNRGAIPHT